MQTDLVRFLFPILVSAMLSTAIQTAQADDALVFISAFASGDEGAIHPQLQ